MEVTVVGAGVIGLSTALALEERGHRVRIVTAHTGDATTSAVAGAVWFPYRAGPPGKVAAWAARTRAWLEQVAVAAPEAGVDVLTGYEITPDDTYPWWAEGIEVRRAPAPVTGGPLAWTFTAPRAQPSLFLPYLTRRLRATIETRMVTDLAHEPGDVVVNCTGLASRELARDELIYPLFGQIAIADVGGADVKITITDDRDPDAIFYIIPRRGELVLGGCSRPYPPGAPPVLDRNLTARVLAQAEALGLAVGPVRLERAGLRPYRLEVRLERDARHPRVIHNYGHGGAGFTLCRGCAEDVAALLG
ncbi:MAG: FAD-dependent oxidoreductase [Acidobacteriota bacterium]